MLKIRWSCDRLIFNFVIPIPGKDGLYLEAGPWSYRIIYFSSKTGPSFTLVSVPLPSLAHSSTLVSVPQLCLAHLPHWSLFLYPAWPIFHTGLCSPTLPDPSSTLVSFSISYLDHFPLWSLSPYVPGQSSTLVSVPLPSPAQHPRWSLPLPSLVYFPPWSLFPYPAKPIFITDSGWVCGVEVGVGVGVGVFSELVATFSHVGGSFNQSMATIGVVWIFSNLRLCTACWARFMCHRELWPTSVSHPISSLNSSLGFAGEKLYQKISIPIFRLVLQIFPCCFPYILFCSFLFSLLSSGWFVIAVCGSISVQGTS